MGRQPGKVVVTGKVPKPALDILRALQGPLVLDEGAARDHVDPRDALAYALLDPVPVSVDDVAHLGHVELLTPKPEESLRFFVNIWGMQECGRKGDSVYLRAWDDYERASLKLTAAKQPGMGHGLYLAGVNHGDGNVHIHQFHQSGSRIDLKGRPHHQQMIRQRDNFCCLLDHGHGFAKPDNMRPKLGTSLTGIAEADIFVTPLVHQMGMAGTAYPGQLAMQVNDVSGPGPFMEVIYVLGNDRYPVGLFQPGQRPMGGVGLNVFQLPATLVIEVQYQLRVAGKSLGGSDVFNGVTFPQTAGIAKSGQAAFRADTRAGQYNNMFFHRQLTVPLNQKSCRGS